MAGDWKARPAGSPRHFAGLSEGEILRRLADGEIDALDEVMGPGESDWVALEEHPRFAEAVADMEPPPEPERPDESRLDMNPLIDVTLVLLIFFILTTTYESLRRVIDLPQVSAQEQKKGKGKQPTLKEIAEVAVIVAARMDRGEPAVFIDGEQAPIEDLERRLTEAAAGKSQMLFAAGNDLPWDVSVKVIDAATGAGIGKILWVPPKEMPG